MVLPNDALLPLSLAQELERFSLRDFLTRYGNSSWLLIDLDKRHLELRSGLLASTAKASSTMQPSVSVLGFQTAVVEVSEIPTQDSILASAQHTANDLRGHLSRGSAFAIQLKKRAGDAYQARVSVGRAINKDVVLREQSVSKFHGWFEVDEDGRYYLADAGSKNGTRVAGTALTPKELVPVNAGQTVEFGSVLATIVHPEVLHGAISNVS